MSKAEKKIKEDYNNYIKEVYEKNDVFCRKQKETQALFADLILCYNEEEKLKAIDQVGNQQVHRTDLIGFAVLSP